MSTLVELRHLRYAIAVADHLHFGRASAMLHLATPSLSKQIRELESQLGYRLFERKTREVRLTKAGLAFVVEARLALEQIERAVSKGRAAMWKENGTLSVGCSPFFDQFVLLELQDALDQSLPSTRLEVHSLCGPAQIDLILDGTLDAGILELPLIVPGLATIAVWKDPLSVALPIGHALDSHQPIDLARLHSENVICYSQTVMTDQAVESVRSALGNRGQAPNIIRRVSSTAEALDLVSAKVGIALIREFVSERLQYRGVAIRGLDLAAVAVTSGIAYRPDNTSDALQALLQTVKAKSGQLSAA